MDIDLQARVAAFNWLSEQVDLHGDVLPRKLLEQGFEFQGQRIPLVAPQGIFKPQVLRGKVYVRHVLTHAEYDRGDWKNDTRN